MMRCPDDDGFELSHEADLLADLATASFVTGGAGLAGGLLIWLLAPSLPEEAEATLVPGPAGVSAQLRW